MNSNPLEIRDLHKAFGRTQVLRGVTLTHRSGVLGLIGRNGSGKTTLLGCIASRIQPDRGDIIIDRRRLPNESAWRRARRGVACTFQNGNPAVTLRVVDVLEADPSAGSVPVALTDIAGAVEQFARTPWNRLSFGQRKLASLFLAARRAPRVLLLDEPAAGLAPNLADLISSAISQLAALGSTVVVVEHNRDFLRQTASEIAVLAQGMIALTGPADAVLEDPRTLEALI